MPLFSYTCLSKIENLDNECERVLLRHLFVIWIQFCPLVIRYLFIDANIVFKLLLVVINHIELFLYRSRKFNSRRNLKTNFIF